MDNVIGSNLEHSARKMTWWLELRGFLALVFGALVLARPGAGVVALIAIFTAYAFADGITALIAAFRHEHAPRGRGLLFLQGLVGIAAGIVAIARPGAAAFAILVIIAVRAIIVGALEVITAIRAGNALPHPWLLGLAGVASIAFGVMISARPGAGLLAVGWLVGLYAAVVGILLFSSALAMRGAMRRTTLRSAK